MLSTILGDVKGSLADGYGKSFVDYNDNPQNKLQLKQNLYRFSGAKTYQELAKMNYFLDKNKSFAEFKKDALKVNQEYNVQYLKTEYVTANRSGAMAEKWEKIQSQKALYPNLKYKTAKDNRVREEHRLLHDIIKPADDPFWDKWYPPNGWHCRCYVTQTDEPPTKGNLKGNPTPGFSNHVGKSKMTFDENEHPYFVFPAADAKKIKSSFEDLKLSSPDYNLVHTNKKASLHVSTWADPSDIENNYKNAKILVDALKVNVKIRPHTDIESIKNPEYEIDGLKSDLKVIDSINGITNGFRSAKAQMGYAKNNYSIVFNLDKFKKIKIEDITSQLRNKFSATRGKNIDKIFFIKDGKAVVLTRDMILKNDYKKLEGIL
ncbi:MAG: phage minor head protein [Flavobacterium circumlabens]|uniref:phage minor head protein n=1 Tax=Flavobacterium circumlabens TaxID=2133765 RepID=UPI0032662E76